MTSRNQNLTEIIQAAAATYFVYHYVHEFGHYFASILAGGTPEFVNPPIIEGVAPNLPSSASLSDVRAVFLGAPIAQYAAAFGLIYLADMFENAHHNSAAAFLRRMSTYMAWMPILGLVADKLDGIIGDYDKLEMLGVDPLSALFTFIPFSIGIAYFNNKR